MKCGKTLFALVGIGLSFGCWAVPIVSNVQMQQIEGTKDIRITYDLADDFNKKLWVTVSAKPTVEVSNWGTGWLPLFSVEGDVRCWVSPGKGKEIIWHAGNDWNGRYSDSVKAIVDARAPVKDEFGICPAETVKFTHGSSYHSWVHYLSGGYDDDGEGDCMRCCGSTSTTSSFYAKVSGSGTLVFYFKQETNAPNCELYVDGKTVSFSPSGAWRKHSIVISGSGEHTIEWRIGKLSASSKTYVNLDEVSWQ